MRVLPDAFLTTPTTTRQVEFKWDDLLGFVSLDRPTRTWFAPLKLRKPGH